jgi:hypothetical protein
MKILNANKLTPDIKELVLELICKTCSIEQSPEELKTWLTLGLGTDIFGAWITVDEDDEPAGVLTCEIVDQETEPKVFISFFNPHVKELLARCEEWARSKNIKTLIYYNKRAVEFLGFAPVKTLMQKEIK